MNKKILCVCSGGGHLTELMEIVSELDTYDKVLVTYKSKVNVIKGIFKEHYQLLHFTQGILFLLE